MEDWHLLIWAKDKPGVGQAKAGDIIDIMPASTEWAPNNKETQLCIIVPVSGLTKEEATALKEPGDGIKRKYKVPLEEIEKITYLDLNKVENTEFSYQPLLTNKIKVDLKKNPITINKTKIIKEIKEKVL